MKLASLASLIALPLSLTAACTDDMTPGALEPLDPATDVKPPADFPTDATARVEVRTSADEVVFARADGTLFGRVPTTNGVARASVPPGSTATALRSTGSIINGGMPFELDAYDTATNLADGDVIDFARAPLGDRPAVTVALPAAPADAPAVAARWCGRGTTPANPAAVELERVGCGDRKGAMFVAGTATGASVTPRYAFLVEDLGDGAALDLSARTWIPLATSTVTLTPAPAAGSVWLVGGGAMLDGEALHFGPMPAAQAATAQVLMLPDARGAVIASYARVDANNYGTREQVAFLADDLATTADASQLALDLSSAPFPALAIRFTAARSLALDGDLAAAQADAPQLTAFTATPNSQLTYDIALRAGASTVTLPTDDQAPGALSMARLTLSTAAPDMTWSHELTVNAP